MEISDLPEVIIKTESPGDIDAIHRVNHAAFKGGGEADVVDQLRETCPIFLSLVAKVRGEVVGHILFTPVQIVLDKGGTVEGIGLAPMAVLPGYQGKGIGSALVRRGLERVESEGFPFVVVLGHPGFYPRFGFDRASQHGIRCGYEGVPDDAFMIRVFDPQGMAGCKGTAYYRREFDQVT